MYSVIEKLKAESDKNFDFSVYVTKQIGDAVEYCREVCETPDEHRFFVCGGDGTVGEVLNGIEGKPNASMAIIPAGTGNDFVRNFYTTKEERDVFLDIVSHLDGEEILVDYMEVIIDGEKRKLSLNVINAGLDCEVAKRVNELRGNKFIPYKLSYYYGLIEQFVKMPNVKARIVADGVEIANGEKTLMAIGNGAYYGGGFKAVTKAKIDDGLLDLCMVENVNRSQFLNLVGPYKAGTHLENPKAKDLVTYLNCKEVVIEFAEPQNVSFDGETEVCNSLHIKVSDSPVRISLPKGINTDGFRKSHTEEMTEEKETVLA